jgi:hypothetical protein
VDALVARITEGGPVLAVEQFASHGHVVDVGAVPATP